MEFPPIGMGSGILKINEDFRTQSEIIGWIPTPLAMQILVVDDEDELTAPLARFSAERVIRSRLARTATKALPSLSPTPISCSF